MRQSPGVERASEKTMKITVVVNNMNRPLILRILKMACAVVVLSTLSVSAKAQDYTVLIENNTVTLTEYIGAGGDVVIPDHMSTLPVVGIADFAFSGKNITGVTVPDTVTSLGDYVFARCPGLTSVTIGNGVSTIGDYAFYRCVNLTNVTIGAHVNSIGAGAFISCDSLTGIALPGSVTSIGEGAFRHCPSLTAITVAESNLVYGSIEGILFNKTQDSIVQCPEGKSGSSKIPDNITSIGDYAFESCASLTNIYFEGDAPSLGLSVFFNANNATVYYLTGTLGWSPTYGDRPTAVWRPALLTTDGMFGIIDGEFGFTIDWANGQVVLVDARTDLANSVWRLIDTITLTNGFFYFIDPEWVNHPDRFYRVRMQ